MKSLLFASVLLSLAALPALADDPGAPGAGPVIGGTAAAPLASDESCIEVEIGGEPAPAFTCINQRLQRLVAGARPAVQPAPVDATSPAVRVGGFSRAGVAQQIGPGFGQSIVPFRPTAQPSGNVLRP
jgi:hypothetical protein